MSTPEPQPIMLPFSKEKISALRSGMTVLLSGSMLVGRDQVHQRLAQLIEENRPLPFEITGETMYYMGPTPAPPGRLIGSCGPTTSSRMDPYTPLLMDHGLTCTIGKGPRSSAVRDAVVRNNGLYLYAFGGCGALYAQRVVSQRLIAFENLGPEALLQLEVKDFPAIVGIDSLGNSVFS